MLMIKYKKVNWFKLAILSSFVITSFCGCSNKTYTSKKDETSSSVSIESSIYESSNAFEDNSKVYSMDENAEPTSEESILQSDVSSNFSETIHEELDIINESSIDVTNETVYDASIDSSTNETINDLINIDNTIYDNTSQDKERLIIDYEKVYNFIFSDGSIKGHLFADLNKEEKAKAVDVFLNFDLKIDNIFPDSIDDIKKAIGYSKDKVSKKLKELKNELGDYISSKIGEDKYNSFIETKDKAFDAAKEQFSDDVDDLKEFGKNAWQKIKER